MHKLNFFIWTITAWLCLSARPVTADTIKLKDGTQYEGTIQSESDTEIKIEVSNASGTIFNIETVKKSDVAEIVRPTPAQRAEMEMQDAYKKTLRYQLDPQFSQPLSYYNQVITDVFQKFLTKYPGSPYEKELNERIAKWTEERDKVGSGMGRLGTEWLPAEEVAKRTEEVRARTLLEKGHQLASHGQFAAALDAFRDILKVTREATLVDDARRSYTEVGKLWGESLERTRETVNAQIKPAEDTLNRLRGEVAKAESDLSQAELLPTDPSTRRLGQETAPARFRMQASSLRNEYQQTEANLNDLRHQLTDLDMRIGQVKTMTAAASSLVAVGETPATRVAQVVTAAPPPVVVPHPPEPVQDTPDVLVSVANFFKNYWVYGLVGFVIIAWAGTRVFTK